MTLVYILIIILDKGISKKMRKGNKEAYWEGVPENSLTQENHSSENVVCCVVLTYFYLGKISREITMREGGSLG